MNAVTQEPDLSAARLVASSTLDPKESSALDSATAKGEGPVQDTEHLLNAAARRVLGFHTYDPRWESLQRDYQNKTVARYVVQTGWTSAATLALAGYFIGAGDKTWLIYLAFAINTVFLVFGLTFMPGVRAKKVEDYNYKLGGYATYITLLGLASGWSIFFYTAMVHLPEEWHGMAVGMSIGVIAMGGMGCSAYPLLSLGFTATVALGGMVGVQVADRPLADIYCYAWSYMVLLLYTQHHFRSRSTLKNVRDAAELETIEAEKRKAVDSQTAAERELFEAREAARLQDEERRDKKDQARKKELIELATQFETTIGEVSESVAAASRKFSVTAKVMSQQASDASTQIEHIAEAMAQVAQGSTAAAAASDEFAISIENVTVQAASAAQLARETKETTTATDATMGLLTQRAEGIGEIANLINIIAGRTRLLAINASIEAARGGAAGRGFEVVASEVKELASQTSNATKNVSGSIKDMQQRSRASAKELTDIREQIGVLETAATSIATAMDQQSHAGKSLAESIDFAAAGAGEVSASTQELRKAASAVDQASGQLTTASDDLNDQAKLMNEKVASFLEHIREF